METAMSYTALVSIGFLAALSVDYFIAKTRLITTKRFWASYGIIIFFQLLTNWWLTSREVFMYDENAIIGWRIAHAPIEDLFFGFSLVLLVLVLWDRED